MLNWMVVGIGDITTKRVTPALQEEDRSALHGILTRNPRKAEAYGTRIFTDLDQALRDGAIGAVYVASPVFLHAPQTIASLRAGKHVLCEKSMAMNYPEACAMVAAARTAQRTLGIGYYRRAYPKLQRARRLLEEGIIGKPVQAYICCHDWFAAKNGARQWLLEPDLAGGGPLYDIGSHRIDVLNFVFGEPKRVAAQLSSAVHRAAVEDSATVLVEYENKVRGIVDVHWHSRVFRDEFRIIGTEGEMDLTPLNGPQLVYPRGREDLPTHPNVHFPCIRNFVDAVLDGAPLLASGASSIWTDWVTQEAMGSWRGRGNKNP